VAHAAAVQLLKEGGKNQGEERELARPGKTAHPQQKKKKKRDGNGKSAQANRTRAEHWGARRDRQKGEKKVLTTATARGDDLLREGGCIGVSVKKKRVPDGGSA